MLREYPNTTVAVYTNVHAPYFDFQKAPTLDNYQDDSMSQPLQILHLLIAIHSHAGMYAGMFLEC